jgi:hypothetical protein
MKFHKKIPIFVSVADLKFIPSDEEGIKEALWTKILKPAERADEYRFWLFCKIKLKNRPLFSPGMFEYFNGIE